jgi:hypothetical protein
MRYEFFKKLKQALKRGLMLWDVMGKPETSGS